MICTYGFTLASTIKITQQLWTHSYIRFDNTTQSLGIDKEFCNLTHGNREHILWNKYVNFYNNNNCIITFGNILNHSIIMYYMILIM